VSKIREPKAAAVEASEDPIVRRWSCATVWDGGSAAKSGENPALSRNCDVRATVRARG